MPDPWRPQPIATYLQWAQFILNHGRDVNAWEQSFTKDQERNLNRGLNLSQRQAEILERIYADKT